VKRFVGAVAAAALVAGILPASALAATGPSFVTQPGGGAPGAVWGQQPIVAIKTGNNTVESATGSITLSITGGTGAAGAVLTCSSTTVNLVAGVATFSGCKINLAGTGYRLTATWSAGGTDTSNPFNITASGTATKLGFTVQPARGTPSAALAVQPTVAVQDAGGATVTGGSATTVTLSLGANPGAAALTCSGGTSKATVNGVAAFTGCRVDKVGVGYTLVATATGLTAATSTLFDVADRLAFTTQPAGASGGVAFTTQPVVAVRAGTSNTATHDNGTTVTLSIKSGTGAAGAVLTCTGGLSKVVTAGVAAFSGCKIDKASPTSPANPYVLVATATGLTSAESATLAVTSGVTLSITTSSSVITWGSSISIGVRFDQSGANRPVVIQGSRDGITWTPIVTVTTNVSGTSAYTYAPVTNLFYRAVFAGATDLGSLTSTTTRTVVRQVSYLRPMNLCSTRIVSRGATIAFTDTVRPARPELIPATVRFVFYRRVSGVWQLYDQRDVQINPLPSIVNGAINPLYGKASTSWTFPLAGEWYVRSQARPTPYNANSVWGPVERYSVR
jgi:trimeric autotransporter adhesin